MSDSLIKAPIAIATADSTATAHGPASPPASPLPSSARELLEQLPDGILILNPHWQITFANPAARRLSHIEDQHILTRTHWQIFPETIGTEVERVYRRVMQSREPGQLVYYYPPFDLWLDIQVRPIPEGIALYYCDISSKKRAEAERDRATNLLHQVLDSADDSIVCIDRDWNCTFANRTALRILKTDSLVGENLWTRFPSNQQEPFASNYRTTMQQRVPTEFEAYYPEPLNIWFRVLARPYEDGIIIFSSDISDRKNAEALRDKTVRRLNQVLEATTDAVFTIDRNWNFTFLNGNAKRSISLGKDLIGKNVWEQFPAAKDSDFYTNYHRTMNEGVPTEFDAHYPEPLNKWFSIQARPYDDGIAVFFRDVTSERNASRHLNDQQAVLSFVQQTAGVATWEIDLATSAMTFGAGSYPVFGHPLAAIRSIEDFRRIVHPDYLPIVQEATRQAFASGELNSVDYQVITSDGSTRWVEGRAIPVYDNSGTPTFLRGMTIDISGRKKNEEQLAASEERYRVLADLNPQAIWMGSPTGDITYANQGFLDYIGLTMEQARDGLRWLEAFAPEDRDQVVTAWNRSIATGTEYEIEARMIRAQDHAVRWWWLRALPIRDDAGSVLNWLGIALDIHDRKMHAEELRLQQLETERQRAQLETIYQTAPIGLALFDPVEFRYLRLNNRQAAFFGLPPEEVIGKSVTEMAPIEGLHEMFEQVAAGNPVVNQLIEGKLATDPPDVHRFWTVNYFPVYSRDGKIEAITAASLEITNHKKAEAALIQSEKLAAVGRLASSISHEINNPLEAITNLLYLVALDESLPRELRPYVTMAQSELSRVCQIATQTLRFHRQAVRATHVTARDLVTAVLNLYQGRLANSGIAVSVRYDTDTKILCFENDIRQVLNNFIANAIDAMRNGGRLLVRAHNATVSTPQHPDGIRGVRIVIADTGHGMTPDVQARVFEPFYTTKDLNGTGLGLWISSGIVSRHNGRLTFRSSTHPLHHGTAFSLFLPLEDDPVHATIA
jgi:PAS domain S-box-containing protein